MPYLVLPALECLHAAWSKHLIHNARYNTFQGPLAAGVAKVTGHYNQTKALDAYTKGMGMFPIILNGFTSHILISITVIHPEYELVHFEKHWGKDLTAQVVVIK